MKKIVLLVLSLLFATVNIVNGIDINNKYSNDTEKQYHINYIHSAHIQLSVLEWVSTGDDVFEIQYSSNGHLFHTIDKLYTIKYKYTYEYNLINKGYYRIKGQNNTSRILKYE